MPPAKSPPAATPSPIEIVEASFFAGSANPSQLPAPLAGEIAFAGRSNVGKSSLINAITGRKNLVRTGATPGVTRQVNMFEVRCRDDAKLFLIDLPGYGYAKRSHAEKKEWAVLIEGYLRERPSLRVLLVLVDLRRGLEDDDRELVEFMAAIGAARVAAQRPPVQIFVVATKVDKVEKSRQLSEIQRVKKAAGFDVLPTSAETKAGISELWARVRKHCVLDNTAS